MFLLLSGGEETLEEGEVPVFVLEEEVGYHSDSEDEQIPLTQRDYADDSVNYSPEVAGPRRDREDSSTDENDKNVREEQENSVRQQEEQCQAAGRRENSQ